MVGAPPPLADACRDIITPRLVLRLMDDDVAVACLAGDLARAGQLLDMAVPDELLDHPTGLEHARQRLADDPLYRPWSARAIMLPERRAMVGHVRFHSRPDPEYLRPRVRGAVELGYLVFTGHRRRGYALEAVRAMMDWAQATAAVRRFVVSVSPDNGPSLDLVRRCGFVKIGEEMDETDGLEHVLLHVAAPA